MSEVRIYRCPNGDCDAGHWTDRTFDEPFIGECHTCGKNYLLTEGLDKLITVEAKRVRRLLSLGLGVQSSAMLLMALDGCFGDPPDAAVFADPGWETQATYEWFKTLKELVAPFPIIHLSGKSIRNNAVVRQTEGRRFVTLPAFLSKGGMGRRQCTKEYKLAPMQRLWRLLGATSKDPIESWIGISTDEAIRIKPSRVKYAKNRFPLIEAELSREDCSNYLRERVGQVPSKSSCIGCPFHGDDYWANLRAESPAEFEDACVFDEEIRESAGMRQRQFLHRSLKPLRSIKEFKHENQGRMFIDGFGNECEGLCGL